MKSWKIGQIEVVASVGEQGNHDFELAVITDSQVLRETGPDPSTMTKMNTGKRVEYWPILTSSIRERRARLFEATTEILHVAGSQKLRSLAFYLEGFELLGIPSWEVAEEIVKALLTHSEENSELKSVRVIAGSPTQYTSLEFALNNRPILQI